MRLFGSTFQRVSFFYFISDSIIFIETAFKGFDIFIVPFCESDCPDTSVGIRSIESAWPVLKSFIGSVNGNGFRIERALAPEIAEERAVFRRREIASLSLTFGPYTPPVPEDVLFSGMIQIHQLTIIRAIIR